MPEAALEKSRTHVRHVAVLIPARDEERLLPRCLRSVEEALARLPMWCTSDVVVVADSSSDRTFQVAREVLGLSGTAVQSTVGCVGSARALAARVALQRFAGAAHHCWLANTDADCEVPPTWLVDQLDLAAQGVDAIAGIVGVDNFSEHLPHVRQRFRDTYHVAEDGTHTHVHGANFGVRADAYLRAGGWGGLATAEDHDLWSRLSATGHTSISPAALRVTTSGRRVGRAPLGFAAALAAHNETAS